MTLHYLCPVPKKINVLKGQIDKPKSLLITKSSFAKNSTKFFEKECQQLMKVKLGKGMPIVFQKKNLKAESYNLNIEKNQILIEANDESGVFYAFQTLIQIFLLHPGDQLPLVRIQDAPAYKTRSYMIDMGRAVYTYDFILHLIKLLARLKINTLHLHLCDDHLGSLKFKKLPLGSENPHSISILELKKIIQFARNYHVSVIPEIECWGHAGSYIYHYPELYGAPGMWEGMSFAIGENLFSLLEKVFEEVIPVLEKNAQLHVGLDEANWFIDPKTPKNLASKYNPTYLVERLYKIINKIGARYKKKIKIHLWADHGGRPLPKGLEKKFVVQPWMYFEDQENNIKEKVTKYGGKNKTPFMMGAGMSSNHFQGHFGATRVWCQEGSKLPNVEGVTICHWENNLVPEQLLGLYGGADYAWSPESPLLVSSKPDLYRERIAALVSKKMLAWQLVIPEADAELLSQKRGPAVIRGMYHGGKKKGQLVAPTALLKKPRNSAGNMDQ